MAQEENYIAIVSQRLSKPGDTRYVIIDKQTQQEVDTCNGRGYKSAQAAHKSFSFKMRRQQQNGGQQGYSRTGYGQTARQVPMNAQSPRDLVSPFVQEASAGYQRSTVVRDDGAPAVTHVNSWSGYAPRRASAPRQAQPQTQPQSFARQQPPYARQAQPQAPTYPTRHHRRPQDVTQENTPPPPDLFGYRK